MAITVLHPKRKKQVLGVLFDMDGVILDTEKLYTRFWQEAAQALGFPMTREQALAMRSLNRDVGRRKMERFFGPAVDYNLVRNERIRRMDEYVDRHGVEAKPGIRELLDALDDRGIPAAVTTSSPMERVERYLSPLGLLHRFREICTGYDVPRGKPEPDIYLLGAERIGVKPGNCIALEDSQAGLLSAFRAGCMEIFIPDQDPLREDMDPFAWGESLADVITLLP